jgi:RNA 2',3'-cyclic 3'-phosphodiesterase
VRSFVAVEVPSSGRSATGEPTGAPDHLTLRFLREIDERTAEGLERALRPAVASVGQFEFTLDGVGAFPTPARPRVVWRGVTQGEPELQSLARVVRVAVEAVLGKVESEPFVPHVTLFRVRTPRDRERAARALTPDAPRLPPTIVQVSEVLLVESRLTPSGAVHRVRARFPLAAPVS